jgi:hypothetical protein
MSALPEADARAITAVVMLFNESVPIDVGGTNHPAERAMPATSSRTKTTNNSQVATVVFGVLAATALCVAASLEALPAASSAALALTLWAAASAGSAAAAASLCLTALSVASAAASRAAPAAASWAALAPGAGTSRPIKAPLTALPAAHIAVGGVCPAATAAVTPAKNTTSATPRQTTTRFVVPQPCSPMSARTVALPASARNRTFGLKPSARSDPSRDRRTGPPSRARAPATISTTAGAGMADERDAQVEQAGAQHSH